MTEVLLLVGTRPEAVKVAPVATRLTAGGDRPLMVHSGQHVGMVEQAELVSQLLPMLDELLVREKPSTVLVRGDTTTALAGG